MSESPEPPPPGPWTDPSRTRPGSSGRREAVSQLTRMLSWATLMIFVMALAEPVLEAVVARRNATLRDGGEGENPWLEGPAPELSHGTRDHSEGKHAVMRGPAALRNRASAEGEEVTRLERGEAVRLVKEVDGWVLLVVEGPRRQVFGWARQEDVLAR